MNTLLDSFIGVVIVATGAAGYFGRQYVALAFEKLLDKLILAQRKSRSRYYRAVERCPGCGVKAKHPAFYNPEVQRLFRSCETCNASWPELTRVSPQQWDYFGNVMKANQDKIVNVREVISRANEPLLRKKEKEEAVN